LSNTKGWLASPLARWLERQAPLRSAERFSALYDNTHVAVFRYVYGLHGGPVQEVEDLTAETFTRAWKARERFHGDEAAAMRWLLQIARRLVIDGYRQYQVRGDNTDVQLLDPASPEAGPEALALADEAHQTLERLLGTLPAQQREMVVLRYLLGWRVTSIADHLDLPENNVSANLRRALARLQRSWPPTE